MAVLDGEVCMKKDIVVVFVGKEERAKKDALARILASAALSGRSQPSVEEIHRHVEAVPTLAFEFAKLLVRLHGWPLEEACVFIKRYYPRP